MYSLDWYFLGYQGKTIKVDNPGESQYYLFSLSLTGVNPVKYSLHLPSIKRLNESIIQQLLLLHVKDVPGSIVGSVPLNTNVQFPVLKELRF